MRVLVCGGRKFGNWNWLASTLAEINPTVIIHGGASGADLGAALWAWIHDVPTDWYPADWDHNGRNAGPIRNTQMLVEGKPDLVVAFPGGNGTANMVAQATHAKVPVRIPTLELNL